MPIACTCTGCGKNLKAPDAAAGRNLKCPNCSSTVIVPGNQSPPSPIQQSPPQSQPQQPPIREKPPAVNTIGTLALIGGIWAIVASGLYVLIPGLLTLGLCCFWPGWIYSIVAGVIAIVQAVGAFKPDAHTRAKPFAAGLMLIINMVILDVVSLILGIIILVKLGDPAVKAYYEPLSAAG